MTRSRRRFTRVTSVLPHKGDKIRKRKTKIKSGFDVSLKEAVKLAMGNPTRAREVADIFSKKRIGKRWEGVLQRMGHEPRDKDTKERVTFHEGDKMRIGRISGIITVTKKDGRKFTFL